MTNSVSSSDGVKSSHVGSTIVGNDLVESAPAAEDTLEDEVRNDIVRLRGGSTSFGIRGKSTTSMDDISVVPDFRHEEGVHMGFAEEGRDVGNHRGNEKVLGLADLTLVTGLDEPANIFVEKRPPKPNKKVPGLSGPLNPKCSQRAQQLVDVSSGAP